MFQGGTKRGTQGESDIYGFGQGLLDVFFFGVKIGVTKLLGCLCIHSSFRKLVDSSSLMIFRVCWSQCWYEHPKI